MSKYKAFKTGRWSFEYYPSGGELRAFIKRPRKDEHWGGDYSVGQYTTLTKAKQAAKKWSDYESRTGSLPARAKMTMNKRKSKKKTPTGRPESFKYNLDLLCKDRVARHRAITKAVREHGADHVLDVIARVRDRSSGAGGAAGGVIGLWKTVNSDYMYAMGRHSARPRKAARAPSKKKSAVKKNLAPSKRWAKKAVKQPGKLGGKGFMQKPVATQQAILTRCVGKYGYRSCLGSVMFLHNITKSATQRAKARKLRDWLVGKYGGPGSFSKNPRKRGKRDGGWDACPEILVGYELTAVKLTPVQLRLLSQQTM